MVDEIRKHIKCTSCKNYRQNKGLCVINLTMDSGCTMMVDQINEKWGITFEECKRFEAK